MMKLPNIEAALVEEEKIKNYLLSEDNSGGKEAFFISYGFSVGKWEKLRDALLKHAHENEISSKIETKYGIKFIIEGDLQSPDKRQPRIRSVWIIDIGKDRPRLVTAYPLEENNDK